MIPLRLIARKFPSAVDTDNFGERCAALTVISNVIIGWEVW